MIFLPGGFGFKINQIMKNIFPAEKKLATAPPPQSDEVKVYVIVAVDDAGV